MDAAWRPTRLTAAQLQERRCIAIKLWRAGQCSRAEVARAVGVTRTSVARWVAAVEMSSMRALRARPRPGRPARLTQAQWARLGHLIDCGALAAGFDSEQWTLRRIAALIERQFGVHYHHGYLERPLKAHGFSLQHAAARASERDELVIARWPTREWMALKKRPAASSARLYSWTRQATAFAAGPRRRGRAAA